MPPLVVPNGVRMALIWSLDNVDYAVNVFHCSIPAGVVVSASVDTWAAAAGAAFDSADLEVAGGLANNVRLARLTARDLREANMAESSFSIAKVGGASSTVLPLGVSCVVTHRTAKAGRSFRGRSYFPGWTEADNTTSGTIGAAAQTKSASFWNLLRTNLAASVNPATLAILSQYVSTGDPPVSTRREPPILTPVINSEVRDSTWDYQRRRAIPGI